MILGKDVKCIPLKAPNGQFLQDTRGQILRFPYVLRKSNETGRVPPFDPEYDKF